MNPREQEIIFEKVVELGFAVLTLLVLRKLMRPDFGIMVKMRGAQAVKRMAQSQADAWQEVADHAATVYAKVRM